MEFVVSAESARALSASHRGGVRDGHALHLAAGQ